MKVIFLDVDGVLNYRACWLLKKNKGRGTLVWDKRCINQLNRIIKETGAEIVVSSTWRLHDQHYEALTEKMNIKGKFIGKTADFDTYNYGRGYRGDEIQEWLNKNPNTEKFIILDDDDDMGKLLPYLIQSDFEDKGLTRELADKAIEALK